MRLPSAVLRRQRQGEDLGQQARLLNALEPDGLPLPDFIARHGRAEAERRIGESFSQALGLDIAATIDAAGTVLTRLVEGGVVALLRQAGKEVVKEGGQKAAAKGGAFFLRYGSKLAPWLGIALSAGVGWVTAYYYGKFLLDECEEALTKIVRRVEEGTLLPA